MLKKVCDDAAVKAAKKALAAAQKAVAEAIEAQKRLEFRCGLSGQDCFRSPEDKKEILGGRDAIFDLQQEANQASGAVRQAEQTAAQTIVESERAAYSAILEKMLIAATNLKKAFDSEAVFLGELSGRGVLENAHSFGRHGLRVGGNFRTGLDNFLNDLNRAKI
jgi:hypothetical protein